MATVEKISLPTSDTLAADDGTKKIVVQPSEGDLRAIAEKGRDIKADDPESGGLVVKTPVPGEDDYPDGGLRAWLVVVGVRSSLNCLSSTSANIHFFRHSAMHSLREFILA